MTISGVADSDIVTIAKNLGVSRSKLASELGYAYDVASLAVTDAGSHAMHVVVTNIRGLLVIEYSDGTVVKKQAASNGVTTLTDHTYSSAGAKTVRVTGMGKTKSGGVTLA